MLIVPVFLVVVVLVVLVVLGVLGIGPLVLRDNTVPRRTEGTGLSLLAVIVGGGALLLVLAVLTLGVGIRGMSGDPEESEPPSEGVSSPTTTTRGPLVTTTTVATTTTAPLPTTTTTTATPEVAPRDAGRAVLGPVVTMHATAGDDPEGEVDQAIGELESGTVLRMRVDGFHPFTTARASQCADARCGNAIDVQFGPDGVAAFQYLVFDDFVGASAGGCTLDAATCSIVVENIDGEGRAVIGTLFRDALPDPGNVTVTPRKGLVAGDVLTVDVDGFLLNTQLTVVSCVISTTRCAKVNGTPTFTVAGDGAGSTQVRAPSCPGRFDCNLRVRAERAFSRSAAVGLAFAPVPGADYDPGRVAAGLSIAVLLLGAAVFLIRRSDWAAIGEEAAPEIDEAEYADLDAIIALLPPEDDDAFIG